MILDKNTKSVTDKLKKARIPLQRCPNGTRENAYAGSPLIFALPWSIRNTAISDPAEAYGSSNQHSVSDTGRWNILPRSLSYFA